MNKADVCFSIDYLALNDRDIKLIVEHNIENDITDDTILTLRPKSKSKKLETTNFCLRDLIALNAKNYSISFRAELYSYKDSVNNFVLRIEDLNNTVNDSVWNFESEIQTFLQKTEDNSATNWYLEWKQFSLVDELFKFTEENCILFSGKH